MNGNAAVVPGALVSMAQGAFRLKGQLSGFR